MHSDWEVVGFFRGQDSETKSESEWDFLVVCAETQAKLRNPRPHLCSKQRTRQGEQQNWRSEPLGRRGGGVKEEMRGDLKRELALRRENPAAAAVYKEGETGMVGSLCCRFLLLTLDRCQAATAARTVLDHVALVSHSSLYLRLLQPLCSAGRPAVPLEPSLE